MKGAGIHDAAMRLEAAVLDDLRSGSSIAEIIDFIIATGILPADPDHEHTESELIEREAVIDPIAQRIYSHLAASGVIARCATLAVTEELHAPYREKIADTADEMLNLFKSSGFQIDFLIEALNPHMNGEAENESDTTEALQRAFHAAADSDITTNLRQIIGAELPLLIDTSNGDAWKATVRALGRIFEVVADVSDETGGMLTVRVLRSSFGLDRGAVVRLAPPSHGGPVTLAIVDSSNHVIAHVIDTQRDQ